MNIILNIHLNDFILNNNLIFIIWVFIKYSKYDLKIIEPYHRIKGSIIYTKYKFLIFRKDIKIEIPNYYLKIFKGN